MDNQWTKRSYFSFSLPNKSGELARFAAQLRQVNIDMLGLWGYEEEQNQHRISCVPVEPDSFREFMNAGGVEMEEGTTFHLIGDNHAGALVETLDLIASEGINISTIECIATGGQFGCFIWTPEKDWDALGSLLI
ncbi:MAG: hypothetical protein IIB54_12390 [Planctomycetes bacterium]|nr:hypothetical protein [Planctomycetota bacterium]